MATKTDIKKMLAALSVFYPRTFDSMDNDKLTLMAELWTKKLEKYDAAELMEAADKITSRSKWMPSIAEIIEALEYARNPRLSANIDDEWEMAVAYACWPECKDADPLSREIVRIIGLERIQMATHEEMGWIKKEFVEMYERRRKNYLGESIDNRLPEVDQRRISEARPLMTLIEDQGEYKVGGTDD